MAGTLKEAQRQLNKIVAHLQDCGKCRCKAASDLRTMDADIAEMARVVQKCRDAARRILKEECCKEDVKATRNKSSRVVIRWK